MEKLSKTYTTGIFNQRQFNALDEVSFTIECGETLGLIGESGCGKSTLARTLLGLTPPSSGKVFFKGKELSFSGRQELKDIRGKMQIIFQHPESALNPRMKIIDCLMEPMRIQKLSPKRGEERKRVCELLEKVELGEEHLNRYPHQLSGGQIQRVVLARILSLNPEFIVADEPTSMLDVSVQAQVLHILKEIQVQYNIAYLFVSHDLDLVHWMSDRVAVMYKGQIVEIGPAEEVCKKPQHPYSSLLVKAFSSFQQNTEETSLIGSTSEDSLTLGCSYAPLCPKVCSICKQQKPELRKIAEAHYIACWQE